MTCVARGRRGTLETPALQMCRVACFRNRIGRAVSSDKCLQPAISVAGMVKLGKFVGKRRFWSLQTEKIWGSLVQNARFELPACLVLILWCSCGIAVPMWEAAKPTVSFLKVSKEVLMCSNVVLRGRRGTSWHSDALHNVSKVVLCGGGQAEHFRRVHLLSRGRCRALDVWCLWCCLFCEKWWERVNCVAGVGYREGTDASCVECHFACQAQYLDVFGTLCPLDLTLQTLHFTLYTPRSTLYTSHPTLCSLHSGLFLYTLHSAPYALHSTLCTLHFTLHSTLYILHSTLYTTLHTLHFTLYTLHFTLRTLHFTLHMLQFTLRTWHPALYTLHSAHYSLHSYTPLWL